jgi:hypothetical protein
MQVCRGYHFTLGIPKVGAGGAEAGGNCPLGFEGRGACLHPLTGAPLGVLFMAGATKISDAALQDTLKQYGRHRALLSGLADGPANGLAY